MKIGQELSGPHGPKFVGYAEEPKPAFIERWGGTLAIAGALFASSAIFMAVL